MISMRYHMIYSLISWQSYVPWPVYRWCICQKMVIFNRRVKVLESSYFFWGLIWWFRFFRQSPWQLEWLSNAINPHGYPVVHRPRRSHENPDTETMRWAAVVSMVSFSLNHSKGSSLDGSGWYVDAIILVDKYGLSSAHRTCFSLWILGYASQRLLTFHGCENGYGFN